MKVLAIYGSLREKAYNKLLLVAAKNLVPEGMEIELLDPGAHFPLFNQDDEVANFPEVVKQYREKIKSADGILIATPEFNRSIPAPLKNMIDWTSRPDGDPAWTGKAVAVTGTSNGLRGASFAQYDVKRIMMYFDAHVMGQPEFYLGENNKKMSEDGTITDERSRESFKKFLAAFKSHVELYKK